MYGIDFSITESFARRVWFGDELGEIWPFIKIEHTYFIHIKFSLAYIKTKCHLMKIFSGLPKVVSAIHISGDHHDTCIWYVDAILLVAQRFGLMGMANDYEINFQ